MERRPFISHIVHHLISSSARNERTSLPRSQNHASHSSHTRSHSFSSAQRVVRDMRAAPSLHVSRAAYALKAQGAAGPPRAVMLPSVPAFFRHPRHDHRFASPFRLYLYRFCALILVAGRRWNERSSFEGCARWIFREPSASLLACFCWKPSIHSFVHPSVRCLVVCSIVCCTVHETTGVYHPLSNAPARPVAPSRNVPYRTKRPFEASADLQLAAYSLDSSVWSSKIVIPPAAGGPERATVIGPRHFSFCPLFLFSWCLCFAPLAMSTK